MKVLSPNHDRDVKNIPPFTVGHAVAGLELGPADDKLIEYLAMLAGKNIIRSLHFVHVLPKFDLFNVFMEKEQSSVVSNFEFSAEVIRSMEAKVRERFAASPRMSVSFEALDGNPLEELLREASESAADLVVIGRRRGAGHHGILARNLARKTTAKALIIPENSPLKIERIVAPIDFSAHSIEVVRTALALRKRLQPKPEIIALNVYEMPNLSVYRIQKTREELKRIMEEDRQAAFDAFLRQHANNERKYITTALIEQQKPGIANYLIEFAAEKSADLIIMGAKGHSKVELLLLGSITEKLLSENENIPVLVVKEL